MDCDYILGASFSSGCRNGFGAVMSNGLNWQPDAGPWVASKDGRTIQSDDFAHDVCLEVTGDFGCTEDRIAYAKELAARMSQMPAAQKGDSHE